MDGWITIGTKLETKSFEAEIKKTERELAHLQRKEQELITLNQGYDSARGKALQITTREYQIMQKLGIAMEDIGNKKAFTKLQEQIERTNNKLITLKEKQENLNKSDYSGIRKHIQDIGDGTERVIKKVARWGLAIFGIRSAYMLIRQSMNTLSQYNEKLSADIQNIRYALASTLQPIIEWIIKLVYKLLGYLQYFIYRLTGKNIFKNVNKGLQTANKQAKELQKTLAGFDEMNILGQNTKQEGTGSVSPSTDLSKIQGNPPEWLVWLADNVETLLPIILGIVGGIIALKAKLKGIKALGIGVAIAGIVKSIQSILKYIEEPTWENFGGILEGLGITLLGIGIAFQLWPVALGGAILLCLGLIAPFWDEISGFFANIMDGALTLGENIKKWLHEKLGLFGDIIGIAIDGIVSVFRESIRLIVDFLGGLLSSTKDIIDGIIKICKGDLKGGLEKIFKGIGNAIISVLNTIIDALNIIFTPLRAIIMVAGNILGNDWTMDDIRIPNVPRLARGGIVHNPGNGVLMGSYIAGEGSSPEAVLPLDDNTLDRLGESIARHMTINANIYNTMNGRVISRELQKIQNESNFAYNS